MSTGGPNACVRGSLSVWVEAQVSISLHIKIEISPVRFDVLTWFQNLFMIMLWVFQHRPSLRRLCCWSLWWCHASPWVYEEFHFLFVVTCYNSLNLGANHAHEGGHDEQLVDLAPIRCEAQRPKLFFHEYGLIFGDILGNVQQVLRHGGADVQVDEDEDWL